MWLNIGEGEGTFQLGKHCEVEISGFFQKIREKRCLFQRFVTSIVFSLKRGKNNSFCSRLTNFSIIDGIYLLGSRTDEKENFRCRIIFQLYLKIKGKDKNKGI